MTHVRIATRGSRLALAQSGQIAERLQALGASTELVTVRTSGDRLEGPLDKLGGKGLFVKEIEEALLEGRADVAVHSAKDLPARSAPGLVVAAIPPREDARDALVGRRDGASLAALPRGARVGTGSVRRTAQLLALRPDLEIVPMRGNVDTRLRKLEEEDLAAVVLACAGLERLGLASRIHERIEPERMLPAVNQGILAVQAVEGSAVAGEVAALADPLASACFLAERAFLERLEGDCNVPLAALCRPERGEVLSLRGLVARRDGSRVVDAARTGSLGVARELGRTLAEQLLREGAAEILGAPHVVAHG
jgi:hydroxymethylbilane synthase